jgi:hypothetical protein
MGRGKQAKVLTETQIKAVLAAVDGRRYPKRDRVMVLLSMRAGLRARRGSGKRRLGRQTQPRVVSAPITPPIEQAPVPSMLGATCRRACVSY